MTAAGSPIVPGHARLARSVAAWSDGEGYAAAVRLAEAHRSLLPRPVTPAQLNGLRNVVSAAPGPSAVRAFTDHQARKAFRHEAPELRDYWQAVGRALADLRAVATRILQQEEGAPGATSPQVLEALHLKLMRTFVQDLVVHSLYLAGGAGRRP